MTNVLIVLLFLVNNIIWMSYLYMVSPRKIQREPRLPKLNLGNSEKTKAKTPDDLVDLMNMSPKDVLDSIKKGVKA